MTSLKGDLRSIMGTPFGGVGHAVLIFSRVTRAAFNSDSVVLQLHDRIEMPEEADGKFQVDGLDPGPIRIELEGGTVHNHGWNIDLPDEGVWSLTDLVDAQVDWSPAVIGRAEAAAREARDHADRAEAGADRVGTAEQVGVWAGEASASASSAASARSGAVTARNAAQSARDAAEGHANRAAASESNAKTSETNAKQSETNAGNFAAVATTAATEAVDAMESASGAADSIAGSVSEAAQHATRAEQYESGAAAYAQNASDAADRVGTAEQIDGWVQQAKDAADRIGTAEQVEGWVDDARNSASSASSSESKAKEYRDAAFSAASSAVDDARIELGNIASDAAGYATESSRSAARAKASETNAKTSETNSKTYEAGALSAAERAEFAAEETIQQVEGDFATRNYVDAAKWYRGIAGLSNTLDNLAEGSWAVAGGAAAESLGLPRVSTGTLMISRMNNGAGRTAIFVTSTHTRDSPEVWANATANSGGWGDWINLSEGFEPSTKQAAVPLTFPRGSSYSDDRPTLTMRIPFKFGAAVKRVRLRLRNYDYRSDHGFPGSYRIVGAGIGKHQINPDGSMTGLIPDGEPVTQLMSSTQMTGPNEARGNWVEVDLEANTDYLLSYSFTADDGMVYTRQTAQCFTSRIMQGWDKTGVTTATPSSMAVLSAILDVDVLDDVPIYGYLGDSQTAAISAARPGYDSWAMVHSRLAGAIPTIHGHAGAGLSEWQDSSKPAYSMSDGMAKFDRMYISMGSNDIGNGRPLTGVQDFLTTTMQNWRKQTSTFVLHNYLPRTSPQDSDTVRRELNDWIRSSLPGGALHTVDIWEATVDPATGLMDERWRGSNNDVHMTSAGNARVALATIGG